MARLETLEAEVAALRRENQQLRRENQQLRGDNQQLRDEIARLKKNSSNSSKPPSSDIVAPPKDPPRRGKKNKIGGQPGHPRHPRPPFDADQIGQICLHELSPEEVRRRRLRPRDSWHVLQQVEWVDKPYVVTEYRARRYVTPAGRIVLARHLPETRIGRFWVYVGDGDHPYDVFTYTANRSRDGPMTFLKGWGKDARRYLQADAFGGYDCLYAGQAGGRVTEVACWAHARRKFYEARTSDSATATQALAYIRLLYDIGDEARRASLARPLADQRFSWSSHVSCWSRLPIQFFRAV